MSDDLRLNCYLGRCYQQATNLGQTLLPWLRMEPSPGAGRPPRNVVGEPTLAAVEEFGLGLATPTEAAAAAEESSWIENVV